MPTLKSALVLLALATPLPTAAQQPAASPPAGPFAALKYRNIGPAASGRVSRVTGVRALAAPEPSGDISVP